MPASADGSPVPCGPYTASMAAARLDTSPTTNAAFAASGMLAPAPNRSTNAAVIRTRTSCSQSKTDRSSTAGPRSASGSCHCRVATFSGGMT
ncbi:hypothetical protein [Streptomyces aureus]|uniref:hypothetical protein n=1 Tax=Streptomyces aureus TaxID=193461 RepID=UPI0036275F23